MMGTYLTDNMIEINGIVYQGPVPYEGFRGAWGLPKGVPLTSELLMNNHLRLAAVSGNTERSSAGVAVSLANAIGWASR